MSPSGIEMMLKASGIDLGKITDDFTSLKDGVIKTLKALDEKIDRIEKQQSRIELMQGDIWKAITHQQNQDSQPLTAQPQPNNQQQLQLPKP